MLPTFYKYVDFLVLRAFIEDNPRDLDVRYEIDKFHAGLTHFAVLRSDCRDDRNSLDPNRTQGQIVTTLTAQNLSHLLHNGGVPLPPKPALLAPGCRLSSKPSTFGRQRPASVNSVQVQSADGSSFDIPPDAEVKLQQNKLLAISLAAS